MSENARLRYPTGTRWRLPVAWTWNGEPVGPDEAATVALRLDEGALRVEVEAPYHDDPPPTTGDLWRYEVVELMLVGADEEYLEIELSPHGRALVLFLHGVRRIRHRVSTVDYRAAIEGRRWQGAATVPLAWLPAGTRRVNAFAIHGLEPRRRYLAWTPTGGPRPDFHRLATFGSLDACRVR